LFEFKKYLGHGNSFFLYYGTEIHIRSPPPYGKLPLTAVCNGLWSPQKITRVFVWAVVNGHVSLVKRMLGIPSGTYFANLGVSERSPIGNDTWTIQTKGCDENQPFELVCFHTDIDYFLGDRMTLHIQDYHVVKNDQVIGEILKKYYVEKINERTYSF